MEVIKRKVQLEFSTAETEIIDKMIQLVAGVISADEDLGICDNMHCTDCPLSLLCESENASDFGKNLVNIIEEMKY